MPVTATALGVVAAFALSRWREEKSRKERLIGTLKMIRDEFKRNVGKDVDLEHARRVHPRRKKSIV